MKRIMLLSVLMLATTGCACERIRKQFKHVESDYIGLKRKVTLYDGQGREIKSWTGRFKVEVDGGTPAFIDDDNKEVKIGGTFTIEEQ